MAQTHLVGSMPLADAEAVFRAVAEQCGDVVKRIPDGETGPRAGWIFSIIPRLFATPGLKPAGSHKHDYAEIPQFEIAEGADPADVQFAFGYDEEGIAAYPTFKRLKDEGAISDHVKFQLSMPTATAVLWNFITPEDRVPLRTPYETRLRTEIKHVLDRIPAGELCVQWDVAVEFGLLEGAFGEQPDSEDEIIAQIVRMSTLVPADVELGYHLCYGDKPSEPGGKGEHFTQPKDTALLVRVANAICAEAQRPVAYIHMPVPIERDDDTYFAPLANLHLRAETQLYLGLMHEEDGLEGARRRIAAASQFVTGFGVGTECGMQNEPSDRIPDLLGMHREVEVPA